MNSPSPFNQRLVWGNPPLIFLKSQYFYNGLLFWYSSSRCLHTAYRISQEPCLSPVFRHKIRVDIQTFHAEPVTKDWRKGFGNITPIPVWATDPVPDSRPLCYTSGTNETIIALFIRTVKGILFPILPIISLVISLRLRLAGICNPLCQKEEWILLM